MADSIYNPKSSGMQSSLHYRLTNEEWLKASRELKPAERTVLYYLRTLDPFGDRELNVKVVDIAEMCGLNKGVLSQKHSSDKRSASFALP
jgi:hypothetical protein